MNVVDVGRALRRHVAVVLVLLVAAAGAAAGVYSQVPVFYQSQAALVVLLPSVEQGAGDSLVPINPYLNIGAQAAQVTASALASVAGSEEFQTTLTAQGVTSDTTVQVAPDYGGGVVLSLAAVDRDPSAAQRDLSTVSDQITRELRDRQLAAGSPESGLLTAAALTSPTTPIALVSNRSKLVGVTLVIGIIIALAVVFLLEWWRLRRAATPGTPLTEPGSPVDPGPAGRADVDHEQDLASRPLVSRPG